MRRSLVRTITFLVLLAACSDPTLPGGSTGTPALSVTPDSAVFTSTAVGATTTATTFTVTNNGDGASGPLTAEFAGTHASDFLATGDCLGSALAPAATCSVKVTFSPQAAGTRVASLSIAAAPGGTIAKVLQGSGTATAPGAATLTLSAAPNDFAATAVGATSAPMNFTVTNTGTAPSGALTAAFTGLNASDFLGTASCLGSALAPAATCVVAVTLSPQAAGSRVASLSVAAAPGGTVATALKGSGTTAAAGSATLTLTPATSDFALVALGTTSTPVTFTVTNTGTAPSGAIAAAFTGANAGDFQATAPCLGSPLAASATCAVAVTFSPSATGSRAASLSVAGAPGGTVASALTGTGITPPLLTLTPTSTNFGLSNVGVASAPVTFTVTNTGTTPTGNLSATFTGVNNGNFTAAAACLGIPLAPGATCAVSVTFTPNGAGVRLASLTFSATPGGSSVAASLTGTGVTPSTLTLSPASTDFLQITVGATSAPVAFTVTNTGTVPSGAVTAALSGPNAGDFLITSTCLGNPLAPSATCIVNVTLTPTANGARTASLAISATPGGAFAAALTGTGVRPPLLTLTPGSADLGAGSVGSTSAPVTFTLANTGTAPTGNVTATTSGINAGDFILVAPCLGSPLAGGATCIATVTFSPSGSSGPGGRSATLSFFGTPGGTALATLTGTRINPPALTLTPASNPFAQQTVGTTSASVPFTVTNTGTVASGAITAAVSGPNAADFLATSTCLGSPLAPSATCIVNVSFSPAADGSRTANLAVTGTPGGTVSSALTGTGASPAHLTIASASAGLFSITNTGGLSSGTISLTSAATAGQDGTLTTNGDTCTGQTLAAGATCSLNLGVTPLAGGIVVMNFTATAAPGGSVFGSVASLVTSPNLTTSAASFSFADAPVGITVLNSQTLSVTVTNTGGTTSSTITTILSGPNVADFVTGGTCIGATVAPAGTCTLTLQFLPPGIGVRIGTLTMQAAAGLLGGQKGLTASGTAFSALAISPSTSPNVWDFGTVSIVSTSLRVFRVTNSAVVAASGVLTTFTVTGVNAADFSVDGNSCFGVSLAPGSNCLFTVNFAPIGLATRTASLVVGSATSPGPFFTLTGTGAIPATLTASPSPINFGTITHLGTSAPVTVTVTNTGGVPTATFLASIGGANAADFVVNVSGGTSPCLTLALQPGASCTVTVTATPSAPGARTATLTFNAGITATIAVILNATGT